MAPSDNGRGNGNKVVGSALVVGAGIGGMQAALDLAETGIKVYLLDRSPAVGGTMAQLDKTFPTNDCAMCIMSPKLVEVGRHLNIDLLNCAEVEGISGEPGNLTVTVRQHPRYVDLSKCTGCGDCAAACPISLPDLFNGGLSTRKAIFKAYPQAIPNAFAIEKVGTAPCRDACPVHQRAQGYVALIAEGRYADAYRTILEDNPFPSICGRVCNHRCEDACNRGQADAPVNIMALKRFVADWAFEHWDEVEPVLTKPSGEAAKESQPLPLVGKQVAVIGSGPAGLTCAQDLSRQGAAVTVFEALPVPGGMMSVGVPPHRLPRDIVQREIDKIVAQGIELKLNHRVEDAEALLNDFAAVFVAVGAHAGVKLPIPGNDLPAVLMGTEFLRQASLKSADEAGAGIRGKRVLVLGGGNVAIDTAMTAERLGASWVGMTCLEGRSQMPAHAWEVAEAEEEGIEVFPARTFKEVTHSDGKVTGVRTVNVDFRCFIEGRPDFDEFPETEAVIPADVVIFSIGQRPESECLKKATRQRGGRVPVDPETLATDVPGIFAGGDVVTGTSFIVTAIAAGHLGASSIAAYLAPEMAPALFKRPGISETVVKFTSDEVSQRLAEGMAPLVARHEAARRPPAERRLDFGEFAGVLSEEEARAEAARCLRCGTCSECNQCVYACRADAIVHGDVEKTIELNVGAVVLTPGVETMPGDIRPEYGYGRYPNVVTSLQFERMLSASGPFMGVVKRPSDAAHPRKVAWIQCVGSRDCRPSTGGAGAPGAYCSSVCCMYATKEAVIAKEHDPNIQPTIFYIDIRSFGKGFEPYIERAKHEHGIRYVRCMVSSVKEVPTSHNLRLTFVQYESALPQKAGARGSKSGRDGKRPVVHEEEFDLVVLSVGLRPSAATRQMAERLGVGLNEFGFAKVDDYTPGQTSRPGVFVAGAFAEPKDIPESVIEASCAAAQVSGLLAEARGTATRLPEYPPERDVSDEPERIGVFVCHCGINIGSVVNVPDVVEYAKTLPGVVYAERNLYTCSQDTQERINQRIRENGLNRVVVASCTPRTHEPLFQDTLRRAELNPHLFEMANIREQDSWVHKSDPTTATEKAKHLVAMAVAKGRRLRAIQRQSFDVDRRALVIGGGLAGMTAALSIAQQGFEVYLVERQAELGGNLRHIYTGTSLGDDPRALLQETIAAVAAEPRVTVLTQTEVVELSGYRGQFRTTVRRADGSTAELNHGAIVVATGGRQITPTEYLYGQQPRVLTQRDLEERLQDPAFAQALAGRRLTMIQCVGSREEGRPYCSRVCCTEAIKNALTIKRLTPDAKVTILYRDIRSYGFREDLYRQARSQGVVFLEYDEDRKPEVAPLGDGRLQVKVAVQPEDEVVALPSDWIVLSAGIEPEPGNAALAQLLKVSLNETGFFLEAHVKLRPVDFAAEGVFLAGLAHSPRAIDETIAQAQAAAVRAAALLSKPRLEATPIVASVNPRLCSACGICVEVCPYGARVLEPGAKHAEVISVLCQGCGACVAACPNKASQQKGFELGQVFGMIEAALSG
jgi:heterodisulfide reductase subunit A-like polyferredoxin